MRTITTLTLLLALAACGGGDAEPKAAELTPTIGVDAACLLTEDAVRGSVRLMNSDELGAKPIRQAEGYAEDLRRAADQVGDQTFAAHLEAIAGGMDDLANMLHTGEGFDTGDFKASAAEVATVCGWA